MCMPFTVRDREQAAPALMASCGDDAPGQHEQQHVLLCCLQGDLLAHLKATAPW